LEIIDILSRFLFLPRFYVFGTFFIFRGTFFTSMLETTMASITIQWKIIL